MKKIICLHQSADLYGSDRSFIQVIRYFVQSGRYSQITVMLPRKGPLVDVLEKLGVEVRYMNMSLLSRTYLKKLQWGKILFPLLAFRSKMKLINAYDEIYVNTSVILDFYLLGPFIKRKKTLHIREIPSGWLAAILRPLIKQTKALVIYNSLSTQASFGDVPGSVVVYNAFEGFGETVLNPETNRDAPLKILLIGRISHWKGQDFSIEALSKLDSANFVLKIVGSTSEGNEDVLENLKTKVANLGMTKQVEFVDFVADTAAVYQWADVVLVPSQKPEPFGRTAIEAMSAGKPVIAANHGGLPEIISHQQNGYLFTPNDAESFNYFIKLYIEDRSLLRTHGLASRQIFEEKFSIQGLYKNLDHAFGIAPKIVSH